MVQSRQQALQQLPTELSAQVIILATHQQQLNHLTTFTEELVRTPQPTCIIGLRSHYPIPTGPFSDITAINAKQEKYDGNPTKFKVLLMQYSMFLGQKPLLYPTDDSQVSFVCSSGGHWIGPRQFGFPDLRKLSFTLLQSIQTSSGMPGGRGSTA